MSELNELAQEASDLLAECRTSLDFFVDFSKESSNREQNSEGQEWARQAIKSIIEDVGKTDMSMAGVAALLEHIHSAGLTLLEQNLTAMVKEKFVECMA